MGGADVRTPMDMVRGTPDTMQNLYHRKTVLLQSSRRKLDYNYSADEDAVAVPQVADGLSGDEILALASEGRVFSLNEGTNTMDLLMKIMMGGWLPDGKRTQWAAFALFLGTLATSIVAWGSGDMTVTALFDALKAKWDVFVAAGGLYFLGEKVDNKVEK